jgi:osmotically-inducible protein OsmY
MRDGYADRSPDDARFDVQRDRAAHEVDLRPGRGRFFGRGPKNYRRSDERIREDICDRLTVHPDVDASDLEVRVDNGIVTISGSVESRHEKRIAELIADDTLGVDDVENQLKVRHGFWATITGERAAERQVHREPERDGPG